MREGWVLTQRRDDERGFCLGDYYLSLLYVLETRVQLESSKGKTESMGVCTKERKGVTAEVLMTTPCTNSLGGRETLGERGEGLYTCPDNDP